MQSHGGRRSCVCPRLTSAPRQTRRTAGNVSELAQPPSPPPPQRPSLAERPAKTTESPSVCHQCASERRFEPRRVPCQTRRDRLDVRDESDAVMSRTDARATSAGARFKGAAAACADRSTMRPASRLQSTALRSRGMCLFSCNAAAGSPLGRVYSACLCFVAARAGWLAGWLAAGDGRLAGWL